MSVRSPQDIQKRTSDFGVRIVKLADRLPRTLAASELGKQLLRAGTSVGANVEEADGAETKKDFIHKISIAHKEARETRFWLRMVEATILTNESEVSALRQEAQELVLILNAILRKSRSSNNRPSNVSPSAARPR